MSQRTIRLLSCPAELLIYRAYPQATKLLSYQAIEPIKTPRYRAAIGKSPPRRTRALYNTVQYNKIPGQRGECRAHCNYGGADTPTAVAVLGALKSLESRKATRRK
jgi:hypothetical protein